VVADKYPRHVALIGEAARHGRLGESLSATYETQRVLGAAGKEPGVRRQPICLLEPPQHLVPAEPGHRRHVREGRRVEELVRQSVPQLPQIGTRSGGAHTRRAVP
jgi:hypothetical protein